ncbi:MAG: hypothetical protein RJA36_969 [Pseudomonadota bacterium]|jgi:predicted PurR-regulated permease PerM
MDRHPSVQLGSYLLAAAAVLAMLTLHLVPAVLPGLMVYALVSRLASFIQGRFHSRHARVALTATIALLSGALIVATVTLLASQLHPSSVHGLAGLWTKVAEIVAGARGLLPPWVIDKLPGSAEDVQAEVVRLLKEHAAQLQGLGREVGVGLVHTLIGSIIGGIVAVGSVDAAQPGGPLQTALIERVRRFALAFERVFVGQGRIALINTGCTAVYLIFILPLFGIALPFVKTMLLLTLVAGFVPVLGNLVSNFVIVVVSASLGLGVALASLAFLILLHKAEYFLAARILGSQIAARAWEILAAMLVMEAAFGIPGLVTAPVIYAYVKSELGAAGLV